MLHALIDSTTNKVDNLLVVGNDQWTPPYGYYAVALNENEECFVGQDYDENQTPRFFGDRYIEPKTYSAYQFLLRFTAEERAAFRETAKTDYLVADFQQLATAAQEVKTDDPMTILGMNYLVSIGLLTEQRKNEIMS
jgi:hypothetical protein